MEGICVDSTIPILYGVNDYKSKQWGKYTDEKINEILKYYNDFISIKNVTSLVSTLENHYKKYKVPTPRKYIEEIHDKFKYDIYSAIILVLRLIHDTSFENLKKNFNNIERIHVIFEINDEVILFQKSSVNWDGSYSYNIIQGSIEGDNLPVKVTQEEINEETCKTINVSHRYFRNKLHNVYNNSYLYIFKIEDQNDVIKNEIIKIYNENRQKIHFANYKFHETNKIIFVKKDAVLAQDIKLTYTCKLLLNYAQTADVKRHVITYKKVKTDNDNISTISFSPK